MLRTPDAIAALDELENAIAHLDDLCDCTARMVVSCNGAEDRLGPSYRSIDGTAARFQIAAARRSLEQLGQAASRRLDAMRVLRSFLEDARHRLMSLNASLQSLANSDDEGAAGQRARIYRQYDELCSDIAAAVRHAESDSELFLEFVNNVNADWQWKVYLQGLAGVETLLPVVLRSNRWLSRHSGFVDDLLKSIRPRVVSTGALTNTLQRLVYAKRTVPTKIFKALVDAGSKWKMTRRLNITAHRLDDVLRSVRGSQVASGLLRGARFAGHVATAFEVAAGIYTTLNVRASYIQKGYSPTKATVMAFEEKGFETIGSAAGGAAGAKAGAILGLAFGSFAGPIGSGVGFIAGGIVGGLIGSKVGAWAGDQVGAVVRSAREAGERLWNSVSDDVSTVVNKVEEVAETIGDIGTGLMNAGKSIGKVFGGVF